jgi:shikimate kinase
VLVSLVGLPGVGKSTVGRRLAKHLDVEFIDCDAVLERRFGESIASFFERFGEAAFRDAEQAFLQELVEGVAAAGAVIATGGGVVVREANRRLLRDRTVCVWLDARPSALLERLGRNNRRPLLQVTDPRARLMQLARQREPWYAEASSIKVTALRNVAATVAAIEQALAAKTRPSGAT